MKRTILPSTVITLILALASASAARASTICVDPTLGTDQNPCGSVAEPCQTIQYAFDNFAGDGATIQLAPGTYNENIVIDRRISLEGAGSGSDPAADSIIVSAVPNTNVIRLLTGGTSATERMIIRNLRVTGGTGGPNPGNGINISSGSYMTFDNVTSTGNDGNGIAFNAGGDQVDFIVSNCDLSGNPGGTGFRVPTSASVDGLSITGSTLDNNGVIGLSMYGPVTDLDISDSTFNDNVHVGIYGAKLHQNFVPQKGAVIDDVTTNGNGRGIALRIYGGSLTISNSTASSNNNASAAEIGQGLDLSVREAGVDISLMNVIAENNEDVNVFLETKNDGSIASALIYRVRVTGSNDHPNDIFCDGCGIWLHALGTAALSNVSITESTVTGNNRGVILEAESSPVTGVSIFGNDIQTTALTSGIAVSDGAAAGNLAYCNNITGSGIGVENQDSDEVFSAVQNYWGEPSGPYHPGTNPLGLGPEVSDNVAYAPWLIENCVVPVELMSFDIE